VSQLVAAIGTASEIGLVTVSLAEPVDLALSFPVPTTQVGVNATGAGCASSLSLAVGDVRRNSAVSFGNGNVGIGGCIEEARIRVADVEGQVDIVGNHANVTVLADDVHRGILVGTPFSLSQGLTATINVSHTNSFSVRNTAGATVTINGTVERDPAQLAGSLFVVANSSLSLGAVQGGVLNQLSIESNSFVSPPSFTLGDILHPGGTVVSPSGDVRIIDNTDIELNGIDIGTSIDGNLTITGNTGFSNAEASTFADSKSIGGAVNISGNVP
jgi:hypothetical protein